MNEKFEESRKQIFKYMMWVTSIFKTGLDLRRYVSVSMNIAV